MIENYLPFSVMAVLTVASPGPGVLMTLDNAIARGWRGSMHGILGLALGAALMAGLTTAGVGLLIRSSQPLFLLLKYAGIAYIFYLTYKTWHRASPASGTAPAGSTSHPIGGSDAAWSLLARGALLQTSNPKSLLFFLSVLPQVVDSHSDAASAALRLTLAIATYCALHLSPSMPCMPCMPDSQHKCDLG